MPTEKGRFSELIEARCQDPNKAALIMYSGEILTYGELIRLRGQI